MKFALVVPQEFSQHYSQHSFEISGLLNWARVLNGDIRMINEDLTPYDLIMTNVSSTETEYISVIRQENPSAKIIAVFDYGFDVVNQYFSSLHRVKQVMERADYIFSVNKNQADWMKTVLPGKEIHYIPHPTDIDNIIKFRRKPEERTMGVAAMWHQYDNYQVQSLEILKAVERKLKRPIRKTLIGLKPRIMRNMGAMIPTAGIPIVGDDHPDPKMRGQPIDPDLPHITQQVPPGVGWDAVLPYLGVEMWYSLLSQFQVTLDLYTVNSIGRFGMDCAGVGVPCVASEKQDSSKLLWPFTTVDPFEPEGAIGFVCKLLKDSDFYRRTEQIALKNLRQFGFGESKKRMMRMLEL